MAAIDFSNLAGSFSLVNIAFPGNPESASSTLYSWVSPDNHDVDLVGSEFTYSAGVPSGGTVTEFHLDLGDNSSLPDLTITGLSFAIADLAPLFDGSLDAEAETDLLWRTVLSGNDTVDLEASDGSIFSFAGDGRNLDAGAAAGGNDLLSGRVVSMAAGDVFAIIGGQLTGGADTIAVSGPTISGDVLYVYPDGTLIGGNDVIYLPAGGVLGGAYGDAAEVYSGGTVFGGDDVIDLSLAAGPVDMSGDIRVYRDPDVGEPGTLVGGDDILIGSEWGDNIYGDAGSLFGGFATGGDDVVYGLGGNDRLYGDWQSASDNAVGGNDTLLGGDGDDQIHGNGGDDLLFGEADNDFLSGGAGNDYLDGGAGDDILRGDDVYFLFGPAPAAEPLTGADVLIGGAGDDTLFAMDGLDSLDGGAGNDTINFRFGTSGVTVDLFSQTVDSGDTIASIENAIGSDHADILFGSDGDNILGASFSGDIVNGLGGSDTVYYGHVRIPLGGGAGAVIDLTAGQATFDAEGTSPDLLFNIENAVGTGGADQIFGDAAANVLDGGPGADLINGLGGSDTVSYASVTDRLFVSFIATTASEPVQRSGVLVDLSGGIARLGFDGDYSGEEDRLHGIENVVGSNGDDVIAGTAGDNRLTSGGGLEDVLIGAGGNDVFDYTAAGTGFDILADFDADAAGGQDFIDLSGRGFDAADIGDTITVEQAGASTYVQFGGDTLYLYNVSASSIGADDFLFA